jgi:hypothetical protein
VILNTTITTDVTVAVTQNVDCYGDSTGELEVSNPNSAIGYSYSWQNALGSIIGEGNSIDSLLAGTYVLSAYYEDEDNT